MLSSTVMLMAGVPIVLSTQRAGEEILDGLVSPLSSNMQSLTKTFLQPPSPKVMPGFSLNVQLTMVTFCAFVSPRSDPVRPDALFPVKVMSRRVMFSSP